MTTQDLFALQKMNSSWTGFYEPSKPYYNLSVRIDDGPWVTLVTTNEFAALVKGYQAVHTLMAGKPGVHIMVHRLVQDLNNGLTQEGYSYTVLEQS